MGNEKDNFANDIPEWRLDTGDNPLHAFGDSECPGCASFAHEPYFTHSAIMDWCPMVALKPRTFDLCQYSYHELAYLHGLDKPRYPVPALIGGEESGGIEIYPDAVVVTYADGLWDHMAYRYNEGRYWFKTQYQ
jgi:hypothetical protein